VLSAALLLTLGCSREPRIDVHEVYPPPRLAAAAPRESGPLRYDATTEGLATVSLVHAGSRASARVPVASGWLRVALDDVATLDGELEFDVSRIALLTAAEGLDQGRVRELLGLDASGTNERARFRVLSTEVLVPLRTPEREKSDERGVRTRVASVRTRGQLELHGFRAVREAPLDVTFETTPEGGSPSSVSIVSARPLRLVPASFGLEARAGEKALRKLLDSATVSVSLRFLPSGK
jgi:hypothetical protein